MTRHWQKFFRLERSTETPKVSELFGIFINDLEKMGGNLVNVEDTKLCKLFKNQKPREKLSKILLNYRTGL